MEGKGSHKRTSNAEKVIMSLDSTLGKAERLSISRAGGKAQFLKKEERGTQD